MRTGSNEVLSQGSRQDTSTADGAGAGVARRGPGGGHGEGWKWAGREEDDGKESGEGKEQRAIVLQQIKPV